MEPEHTLGKPLIADSEEKVDLRALRTLSTDSVFSSTGVEEDVVHRQKPGCDSSFGIASFVAIGSVIVILTLILLGNDRAEGIVVLAFCLVGVCFTTFQTRNLLQHSAGTARMQDIAQWIQQGSNGFFKIQYKYIGIIAGLVGSILFVGFLFRPMPKDKDNNMTALAFATITTVSFLVGSVCSCAAGYIGLWVSVRTNIRVASAARSSYHGAIKIAMQGGFIAATIVVTLVISGILVLFYIFENIFVGPDFALKHPNEIPSLLVGYGFGASFVALFAQLGGGIFTKAADVGADLVGKVEASLPEDDPRNPAVIADLVGDNVGDCAGRGADLFESIGAEVISAMILGGTLAKESGMSGSGFVFFPLVIHGFDIIVSTLGFLFMLSTLRPGKDSPEKSGTPLGILSRGLLVASFCSVLAFSFACYWLLSTSHAPAAWWHFLLCGMYGMVAGYSSILITTYYTGTQYKPVNDIGEASVSGHATNIIMGVSIGMESTALPIVTVSLAILGSYWTGNNSGLHDANGVATGGIFGTAVATMGMLSTAVYILAMDFFGPIADNAGGIVEMSNEPEHVRRITDELDAVGNTTKAATKGYAVCSATLASFLLFAAFKDEVESIVSGHIKLGAIDLFKPEIFVSGLLGAMLIYLFTSMTLRAVGDTATQVVTEVRKQFADSPGILTGDVVPDYQNCVSIVTAASLKR